MNAFIETRYSNHPDDVRKYHTAQIHNHFLVTTLFVTNEIHGIYTLNNRLIVGGIFPDTEVLTLKSIEQLKAEYFLDRREI